MRQYDEAWEEEAGRAGIGVSALGKSFGRNKVLSGIDLAVRPGEFVCLLGPSGCGKTTLLRLIAGLDEPDAGRIVIGDRPIVDVAQKLFVPPEERRFGMVFQHYALWPHMTVEQNLAYPLRKQGVPRSRRLDRIEEIVTIVGLRGLLDRRPSQLSGGQQQRVALTRALIYAPPVLLLDEPLSNLDATLRAQLRRELRQLHERLGTTAILVTHDQEEAAALADTIAVMYRGQIVQIGTARDILRRPRNRFVAEFVGFDNFLPGIVRERHGDQISIALGGGELHLVVGADGPASGDRVAVGARSDTLRLRSASIPGRSGPALRGTVRHLTPVARGTEYEVAVADLVIVVREIGDDTVHEPGTDVVVEFPPSRTVTVEERSASSPNM
jgi:ABC-type Fe3+/spermidine/putrescine transport system ATPase subunit